MTKIIIINVIIGLFIGGIKNRLLAGFLGGLFLGPLGWILVGLWGKKGYGCPDCQEVVKKEANVCKHCGNDLEGINLEDKKVSTGCGGGLSICFLIVVGLMLINYTSNDFILGKSVTTKVRKQNPDFTLNASELREAYTENEVKAAEKYNGKIIQVHGTIDNISKTFGQMYIVLKTDTGKFNTGGIQCFFPEKSKGKVANLEKGERIEVKGRCNGLAGSEDIGNVLLKECSIVD